MVKIELGSIVHGTHLPSDLVPAFLEEAKRVNPESETVKRIDRVVSAVIDDVDDDATTEAFWLSEFATEAIQELDQEIGSADDAPPYFYFGAHPGDGSDFGWWFDNGAFEYAVNDREIVKVDGLPDDLQTFRAEHRDAQYIAVISDHGNVELYCMDETPTGFVTRHLYGVV